MKNLSLENPLSTPVCLFPLLGGNKQLTEAAFANHIRFGLVLRNEYPAWYFYREKSGVIRSIFVPQERMVKAAFAKHIIPMLLRDIISEGDLAVPGIDHPGRPKPL